METAQKLAPLAYCYASGYKTRAAAHMAFLDMCEAGECSESELFAFEVYWNAKGARRWRVMLCAA